MAHQVVCAVCGEKFDRDIIQAVKKNATRYAHYSCYPTGTIVPLATAVKTFDEREEEKNENNDDRRVLMDYIRDTFDHPEHGIYMQVEKLRKTHNYTYSGMYKTLKWWYEVKHHSVEADNPVGIITYAYNKAGEYYYALWQANEYNKEIGIEAYSLKQRVFDIEPPKYEGKKKKEFNFGDLE